jgi:Calcineurin-like phosphoesterase
MCLYFVFSKTTEFQFASRSLSQMRILVFSDLQATDGHERCFGDPSKSLQLWRVRRLFESLRRIFEDNACDALWELGDLTDDRSAIPVPVIDALHDLLKPFESADNIKLVGNHEQWLRDTSVHSGKMFRNYFHVVETCERLCVENVNILAVSYHDDLAAIMKFLVDQNVICPAGRKNLLIGHFQLVGSQMLSGMAVTGVPEQALKFVNLGLLGHIHRPQSLGNMHYVGSPFQQNWGESGENKRVAILDIDGGSIDLHWVPLDGFPKYLELNLEQFLEAVQKPSEDRYKVVLASLAETERFYAHPQANRVDEVIYAYQEVFTSNGDGGDVEIANSKQDIMSRYLQRNPPRSMGIDMDEAEMLGFGEQILEE